MRILRRNGRPAASDLAVECQLTDELLMEGRADRLSRAYGRSTHLEDLMCEHTEIFRAALSATPFIVALKDRSLVYRIVNPAFCDYVGTCQDGVLGRTDYDLFPREHAESYRRDDLQVLCTGEQLVREEPVPGDESRWMQVVKTPVLDRGGSVNGVLCSVREITEAKRLLADTRTRLAETRRHHYSLRCLINNIPVGAVLLDSQLRVLDANKTYSHHFDSATKWHVGARIEDVLPNVHESGIMSMLQQALETRQPVTVREFAYDGFATGTTYWSGSAIPVEIPDKAGRTRGVAMVVSDVTDQVRCHERIEEIYRREHAVAEKLQRSFLPEDLPKVEGFEIGERYRPGLDEAMVGGDFHDIYRLREHEYAVVIGDVAGKGLNAAVYTAMTKYMLRAYALEGSAPELALARLNEALSACTPPEIFVTLVYGVLNSRDRTFTYGNAGHEQPVYFNNSGQYVTTLDVTGRALALARGAIYGTHSVRMEPGDLIMLYTDGITDAGWGANRLGQDRLLQMFGSCVSLSVAELADFILNNALEFATGKMGDDAALLIIRAIGEENG